jgi:nitroreductase
VCSTQALQWDDMPNAGLTRIDETKQISAEQAEQWLKTRRSIRAYRSALVPRDVIERALQAARFAPSGHNRQPVSWTVLSGVEKVSEFSKAIIEWMRAAVKSGHAAAQRLNFGDLVQRWDEGDDLICRRAPHLLLAHAPKAETTAPGACTIAVTYLQLAATGLGLGTCWAGYVMIALGLEPGLSKTLRLPDGHQVFAATMLGYAQYKYQLIPARKPLAVSWQ